MAATGTARKISCTSHNQDTLLSRGQGSHRLRNSTAMLPVWKSAWANVARRESKTCVLVVVVLAGSVACVAQACAGMRWQTQQTQQSQQ